ncbi:hypothetical protein NC652_007710 [Populus alba x Populus x berolinensis]|nr:hypothetical protein NC652_007710 [Populus alba x Populus x berolinensis]
MTSESAMRPYGARKVANKDFNSKKIDKLNTIAKNCYAFKTSYTKSDLTGTDVVADREFIRTISQPGFFIRICGEKTRPDSISNPKQPIPASLKLTIHSSQSTADPPDILVIVLMWFIFYNGSRYVTDFCKRHLG